MTQTTMTQDPYYYDRAEAELKMAERSAQPAAVKAHYELANRYLDRFYNPDAIETADEDAPVPTG